MKAKKNIIICIICCMVLIPGFAFASSGEPNNENSGENEAAKVTISERDIILQLQEKTDEELVLLGFTQNEIRELHTISDESILNMLKELPAHELRNRGYSREEILQIQSGISTFDAVSVTYGKLTYSINYQSYYYNSATDKTYITGRAEWSWSKAPATHFTDTFAVTTNDSDFTANTSIGKAYYGDMVGGAIVETSMLEPVTKGTGTGVFVRIPVAKGSKPKKYAYSGSLITEWSAGGRITSVSLSADYAHSIINASVEVSFSNGEIEFTPKIYIDEANHGAVIKRATMS